MRFLSLHCQLSQQTLPLRWDQRPEKIHPTGPAPQTPGHCQTAAPLPHRSLGPHLSQTDHLHRLIFGSAGLYPNQPSIVELLPQPPPWPFPHQRYEQCLLLYLGHANRFDSRKDRSYCQRYWPLEYPTKPIFADPCWDRVIQPHHVPHRSPQKIAVEPWLDKAPVAPPG